MKNSKRIAIFVLSLVILSSGSLSARSKNVRYNQQEKMTYSENGVYQEAFYDYGTIMIFDDAKITSISRGARTNYVSIKFADYNERNFEYRRNTTYGSKMAKVEYVSKGDYLRPGSYSYNEGVLTLDLNVTR